MTLLRQVVKKYYWHIDFCILGLQHIPKQAGMSQFSADKELNWKLIMLFQGDDVSIDCNDDFRRVFEEQRWAEEFQFDNKYMRKSLQYLNKLIQERSEMIWDSYKSKVDACDLRSLKQNCITKLIQPHGQVIALS